jgi:hypothetical protein
MFFLVLMVAVVVFPLCMDVVEEMVVRMVPFKNKSKRTACSASVVQ